MGSNLSASSHANHCRAELVLKSGKDPFRSRAVPIAPFPVGVHRTLRLSAPGIGVDDRNTSLVAHQILDRFRIVGGIGQGVEERRPFTPSLQEIRSGLTVMNRGPCQNTGQRDLSIGRENMELEPFPCFPLPLAVLFESPVALLGQGFQDLSGTHPDIPGQRRKIFRMEGDLRRDLSLISSAPSFWGSLHLRRLSSGPFPSLDGRAIQGDMFDELRSQMCVDHGSMDSFGHVQTGQLGKNAREGRFMGDLRRGRPPAYPSQTLIGLQSVDQGTGGRKPQDRLRDKGSAKNAPLLGGTPCPLVGLFDRFLHPKSLKGLSDLLMLVGQTLIKRTLQFRKERILNPILVRTQLGDHHRGASPFDCCHYDDFKTFISICQYFTLIILIK